LGTPAPLSLEGVIVDIEEVKNEIIQLEAEYERIGSKIWDLKETARKEEERLKREEEANRIGLRWKPGHGDSFYGISQVLSVNDGGTFMVNTYQSSSFYARQSSMPFFRTREQAAAFGEAFKVLLELRAQPGVVDPLQHTFGNSKAFPSKVFWAIIYDLQDAGLLKVMDLATFTSTLSPAFSSRNLAYQAIEAVGRERILKAFKTLQFIND
jgi:hypothetical protein